MKMERLVFNIYMRLCISSLSHTHTQGNIGNDSTFEDERPEMRDIEKITEDCK